MMSPAPIVIADDHPLFSDAFRRAVSQAAPDRTVLQTGTLAETYAVLNQTNCGLLCLDLMMPDSDGFAGLLYVRAEFPALPVIIVSAHDTPDIQFRARELGAIGFLTKSLPLADIQRAIESVLEGERFFVDNTAATQDDDLARLRSLTRTQLKVLLAVRDGQLNKQIAIDMGISEATVKAHMTAIMQKLEVRTRTQAALLANALQVQPSTPQDLMPS